MIQGYCRTAPCGRLLLGFVATAPIFEQLAPGAVTQGLTEAVGWQPIIGYSVVKRGEAQGFLWYSHEHARAIAEAEMFTALNKTPYDCIPLAAC